ncbi:hypothetical protein V6N13_149399 [Hibiscus sabdariffa]
MSIVYVWFRTPISKQVPEKSKSWWLKSVVSELTRHEEVKVMVVELKKFQPVTRGLLLTENEVGIRRFGVFPQFSKHLVSSHCKGRDANFFHRRHA